MFEASKKAIDMDRTLGLPIILVCDEIMFKQYPNGEESCLGKCIFGSVKIKKYKLKKWN